MDSLFALIAAAPDSARTRFQTILKTTSSHDEYIEALAGLGHYYHSYDRYDSALTVLSEAQKKIRKKTSRSVQGRVYEELGSVYIDKQLFTDALKYNRQAITLFRQIGDSAGVARCYRILSKMLCMEGKNTEGIDYLLRVIKIAEAAGDSQNLAQTYNDIGVELYDQALYDDAIKHYRQAIEINSIQKNSKQLARNYANLGLCYTRLVDYTTAQVIFSKALNISDSLGYDLITAQTLLNQGNVLKKLNRWEDARHAYLRSMELSRSLGLNVGVIYNYVALATLENNLKNYPAVIPYAQKASQLIGNQPMPYELSRVHENLYEAYHGLGRMNLALEHYIAFHSIQDSLKSVEKHRLIVEMKTRYETEKQEKELMTLRQREMQKTHLFRLIVLIVLIIIIASLGLTSIYAMRNRLARQEMTFIRQELEHKNNELKDKVRNIAEKNRLINTLESKLNTLPKNDSDSPVYLHEYLRSLSQSEQNFSWLEFEERFKVTHGSFVTNLKASCPHLTPIEIQICMLLYLNLSSKEIAEICYRSIRTIETVRLNIRKKLNLDSAARLSAFLQTL